MKRTVKTLVVVVAMVFVCSAQAEATLVGDTINWQWYYNGGPHNGNGSPGSFLAGSTTSIFSSDFVVSATDSQIIFDFSINGFNGNFSPSIASYNTGGLYIENGILLTDISANPFSSISLDVATNMAGFSLSNVTFNTNQLAINYAGLGWATDTMVVLNVSSAVPEPSTLLFLGSGLVGLAAWRWKRAA